MVIVRLHVAAIGLLLLAGPVWAGDDPVVAPLDEGTETEQASAEPTEARATATRRVQSMVASLRDLPI